MARILFAGRPVSGTAIRISAQEGGASGFIAGRSVWREVVSLTDASVILPEPGGERCRSRPTRRRWT
jgi:tagatose-1,6-bisphosphate aldolase